MGASRLYQSFAPYRAADLSEIDFVQFSDRAYTVHLDYPPYRLNWAGHTDWTFTQVTFGPTIAAPTSVAAAPTQPNATGAIATAYTYYVTAVDANGQESRASTSATATNDLSLQGNYNTVTWDAVTDAVFYTIYKGDNSTPGYLGTAEAGTLSFKDRNLIAVQSDTPPLATNPFDDTDKYPSVVNSHQQRLMFARTRQRPNATWGSKSSDFENMDVARPAKPDDALAFALVTEKVNSVNQMASMKDALIQLTGNGVFAIKGGGDGGAMTPAAIVPERQTGRGAARLKPLVVDSILFYQPLNTAVVRALGFSFESDGYRSNNVSIFSPHFFKGRRIVSWAYQEEPYSCIWAALDNGELLCFTWEEEQQVWGWTKMEIAGTVEQVTTINEGGYDRLYALIKRTFSGVVHRFHERLALPHVDDITTACHLDCSVTQVFLVPSAVVTGLEHLEGETVYAYADGYLYGDLLVEGGRVMLEREVSIATVGIGYDGLLETLPFVLGQTQHVDRQTFGDLTIRALETRGLTISADGITFDPLPDNDLPWTAPQSEARDFTVPLQGNWTDGGTLMIQQAPGLPGHVAGIFAEVLVSEENKG